MINRLFIFFILTAFTVGAQPTKDVINDFSVVLHEEAINKVIAAIGDIKGTNDFEVLLISGKYHWTVQNPKINIRPDSSDFTCNALVNVGPFDYKTQVVGIVKITYDNEKNLIYIKISRAIFELYTMLFNKKIHIKDIHLEDYFKEPFAFEGPKTMATDMEFMMPDSTMKKIYVQPKACKMELRWKEIATSCEIVAADKPFKPVLKLVPPIEATKTSTITTPKTAPTHTAPAQKK